METALSIDCTDCPYTVSSIRACIPNEQVSHSHIPYCGMRPSLNELYFCCLGKRSQAETSFKTNFLPMKGENLITSYCSVLTFKLAKMCWLKTYYFSEALDMYFSWIMTVGMKLMTRTTDGCLTLNKLGRRRVKLCQRVTATLQC